MRLGFFTMPLHPAHRPPAVTLQEDREAVILADRLGYYDAFVGEHLTEPSENVTNSFIFLATLIHHTRTIKLATGTSNLSQSYPALAKRSMELMAEKVMPQVNAAIGRSNQHAAA